jgi:WD40 repeat protein
LGPGRPEVEELAAGLRKLREQAGSPGYRELARRAHFSATTLSDAAGGRRLPTLAVTLAFVEACGGDRAEWKRRWREAEGGSVQAGRPAGGLPGDPVPYQGLAAYGPERAEWFFGRADLVTELVDRVARRRLLAVFGPSGSGKSSLLRAGLAPALAGGLVVVMTPSADPFGELAVHLARLLGVPAGAVRADLAADPAHLHLAARQVLAGAPAEADLCLVIDQFEELFTLCHDEPARAAFVSALLAATGAPDSRLRVVLGVRADHYGRCAELADLPAALADGQVLVGPMTATQVRDAVVRPAERAGAMVEGALVSTIVAQVAGRVGALPMASHALLEAWHRRRGSAVTLAGYEAAGGMSGAIAKTADRVWEGLDNGQRRAARYVLSRLVEVGTGDEPPSGRRADRAEFDGGYATTTVLERLAEARLITVDERTVRLAHEALLTSWPRLREWLDDDRDGLRLHRQLTQATAGWESLGRDPGALYRGLALSRASAWASANPEALTPAERRFLDASRQAYDRWVGARRRRGRALVAVLAGVAALVTVLASVAAVQAGRAGRERDEAFHRRLIADAWARLERDPQSAFRLASQAFGLRPDPASEVVLRQATLAWRCTGSRQVFGSGVTFARLSAGGRYAVAVGAGADGRATARVWDRADPHRAAATLPADGRVFVGAVSDDGRRAAVSQVDDGTVLLWSLARDKAGAAGAGAAGARVALPGHQPPVRMLSFSPDGRALATVDGAGVTRLWTTDGPRGRPSQRTLPGGGQGRGRSVAFSPDGRRLASSTAASPTTIWVLAEPARPPVLLPDSTDTADDLAFSPDGTRLVATDTGRVRAWPVTGGPPVVLGRMRDPLSPAFSAGGRRVVTSNQYGVIGVLDATAETEPLLLRGHEGGVWATAVAPGGELVSVGADGTVRTWDIGGAYDPVVTFPHDDLVHAAAFSPDGRHLATGGIGDGMARVWAATAEGLWHPVVLPGHAGMILDLAFEPGATRLASLDVAGTVRVWDWAAARPVVTFEAGEANRVGFSGAGDALLTSGAGGVRRWRLAGSAVSGPVGVEAPESVGAFQPGGDRLVTGGSDGTARIRADDGRTVLTVRGNGPVNAVAFSRDGRRAASLDVDSTIRSWPSPGEAAVGDVRVVTHLAAGEGTATSRLTFTADGGYLAVLGGAELTGIQLWSATATADPVTVRVLGPGPMGFTFAPDGRRVVSMHADGSVRIWDCEVCGSVDQLLAAARTRATGPAGGVA